MVPAEVAGNSRPSPDRLAIPLLLVLIFIAMRHFWPSWQPILGLDRWVEDRRIIDSLPVLLMMASLTWLIVRMAHGYAHFRLGHPPPQLVRQIIALLAVTVGAGITVVLLFDVPLGSLLTTSGLLVAVIGIALKNMISDLFNGLSLPVKLGDWVDVAGVRGEVIAIAWRTTKLRTADQVTVVVPNTHFITNTIRNFSNEDGYYIETVKLVLPLSATAYQAERILIGAARQVDEVVAIPRLPEARILHFTEQGVQWELRFPVPSVAWSGPIRHRIQRILMRDFYYSGIQLPIPMVEVHRPPALSDRSAHGEGGFLQLIDLFSTLTGAEMTLLRERMRPRLTPVTDAVVQQGEPGESLFIVQEGLLAVLIEGEGGVTEVGRIRPGQFFGEMSLLTGAPRSATVRPLVDSKLFEVTRDVLAPILEQRPEIAALMSKVLAERQLANAPKLDTPNAAVIQQDSLAQQILGRITNFFRLPGKPTLQSAP